MQGGIPTETRDCDYAGKQTTESEKGKEENKDPCR